MVAQIQQFAATINAGTAKASPVTVQMQISPFFMVSWLEIEVPDGPNGEVGFYIASSNVQVFPFNNTSGPNWIVTNGARIHWDLTNQTTSGDWQLKGYNTGAYNHTVYVTFGLDLVGSSGSAIAAAAISSTMFQG